MKAAEQVGTAETSRLELRGFTVRYLDARGGSEVAAVRGVDLTVLEGEAVGVFGESGSGKSSLVTSAFGLAPETARVDGEVWLDGERVDTLSERKWCDVRGRRVGLVFQQPALALHPLRSVGAQLRDVMRAHRMGGHEQIQERAAALWDELGLAREHFEARSHQLSGGQQQRVCLALALACEPSLLIADEPTAALDVDTENSVLELVDQLRRRRGLSLLWISHDPSVLERLCHRLYVMYGGHIVEVGPTAALLEAPGHPYLASLLACRPKGGSALRSIPGEPPDPRRPRSGCSFAPRCSRRLEGCSNPPSSRPLDTEGEHRVWCINPCVGAS